MEILRLKEVLSETGVSGKALAEKVNVSENTISNIVNGKNFPKPKLLFNISKSLDVDIRELFNSTKGGELLNGYVECRGQVYTIRSIKDLEKLMNIIKNND